MNYSILILLLTVILVAGYISVDVFGETNRSTNYNDDSWYDDDSYYYPEDVSAIDSYYADKTNGKKANEFVIECFDDIHKCVEDIKEKEKTCWWVFCW